MITKILPLVKDSKKLENRLKEIPQTPGVYLMRDSSDRLLYIGKSKKLRNRVRSYFRESKNHSHRISLMVQQVVEIEFIVTDTEAEALALEANLVKQHQPYFNVLLKDDKKYPYLCITWSEDYPRVFITRKRRLGKAQDRYYGPYVDTRLLRNTLHLVKQIFPLRQRQKPLFKDRPCLNYDIGRCPGVCQALITPDEYHKIVQKVAMIFQGRTGELIDILNTQMAKEAETLNFEKAAAIRDQIRGLDSLNADQKVSLPDDRVSRDAIALAGNDKFACVQLFQIRAGKLVGRLGFIAETPNLVTGESKELGLILQRVLESHYQTVESVEIPVEIIVQYELLESEFLTNWLTEKKGKKVEIFVPQRQGKAELIEMVKKNAEYELARLNKMSDRNTAAMNDLAEILDMPELPHRIEGYDISHIQGSDAVASRVVFIDGLPAKQHYRHYKIQNPEVQSGHSDDFASMAEVIQRRFRNYEKQPTTEKPDLIMIDGGKGQLSAVMKVIQDMELLEEVRVVSLAKQREEIFLPGESLPLKTNPEQLGVQLLRRLRDEAHRFAVSFHRDKRSQRMKRSRLDEIPGLGHHRQKLLLGHFHSVDYIRMATVQQLAEVSGVGPKLAQQIYDYFHPS
ncbi:MAG: excinuclease ABC subunit UvrC [Okeania sp. SIO2C9]|uniref:excinuclease ABC subunit UvrC n=1 Tax=Okeania sp. SIO2C9 TaxID=2607791 RepID=UPI0013C02B85|nr:excinuclease ABC subunit UvrC [Okeania sp. SIO2C9]NEQ76240.1 excinuclease ABC subunit UvrC [Okeania sp. SIO2C9]